MPALPTYVKIGQVSGTSLVVGVDTVNDVDTAPDAAFPSGSTFTFDPSIQYLRYTATHYTAYLQSCKAVVAADGSLTTPGGDPLFLVANLGQLDDEADQRDWYWKVTPAIAGVDGLPAFRLDVAADGTAYLTDQQPVPLSPTLSALKGDQGDPGTPGLNVPPAGTPDDYVACSIGDAVLWRDPASLGLVGTTTAVDNTAGTATFTQGVTSATVYQKSKADTLLGQRVPTSSLGASSGVATLGANSKLTASQSPVTLADNGDGTFTVSIDGGASETTYTKAELDAKFGSTSGSLADAGVKTANYTMSAGELVRTDNSTNSLTITLPVATPGRRQLIRNIALIAPNATTVYAGDTQTFDDGSTAKVLDEVGMILDVEAISGGMWAVRGLNLSEAGQDAKYDPIHAAQTVSDTLSAQIQALQRQLAAPPTITEKIHHDGAASVGAFEAPGLWIEQGFPAQCVRLYAKTAPVSTDFVIQAKVAGVVVHTMTLPVGQLSAIDLAPVDARTSTTGLDFTDGELLVDLEVTQGSASDVLLVYSSAAGSATAPVIGSLDTLVLTAQPGGFTASSSYSAVGDNDLLDHYSIRWSTTIVPQSLSDGTAGPDVDGATGSPTFQVGGLPYDTDVNVSAFAVGSNGAVSAPSSGTVHTQVQNPTAPLPGTLSLVSNTKTVYGCLLNWTADPSNGDVAGIFLREARGTATPPATVSSGRPANSGTSIPNNTGTGLWVPLAPGSNAVTISINDFAGSASTNFAFTAFPKNTSGVVNTAAPTTNGMHVFTPSAAPTTGQGRYGLIPATARQTLDFEPANFTTSSLPTVFGMDQAWGHPEQGPSARSNWAIIADPITTGRQILRLTGQLINNGWYKSTVKNYDPVRADGVTNGTGNYGARGNVNGQDKQYGWFEITCRTAAPWANGWKGGNVMRWPLGTPSPWPQGEGDDREIWAHLAMTINEHYYPGSGDRTPGTQVSVPIAMDESIDQTVTCGVEAPVGSDPARIRVWYTQVGVDLGSGVGVSHLFFDTGKPSASIGPTPAGTSATKIAYLVASIPTWHLGFSLAYAGSGSFNGSMGSQYFDIVNFQLYDAPV